MRVFSTLSGQKEEFLPPGSEVKIYVCGVTPYDASHLGHAMSYVFFDTIRRYLIFRGYRVKYVQNLTDIDDKIIERAAKQGVSPQELADKFIRCFFDDMAGLNIMRADHYPRATEEVPKIIEVTQGLVDKGFAYPAGGSVYFRVRKAQGYGKLAHRTLDSMMAGARVEPGEEKEDPLDFVLWKAAKPGEPAWESPWGPGRPGWHIECSAMALKYLGDTIDIHGGGQDLIFPHHENEIAQSECFTGKQPFVRYWLHNGLLRLGEEKMSKSLGNLVTIREGLDRYGADAMRLFILSSSYRGPLTYSEEAIEAARKGAERLRAAYQGQGSEAPGASPAPIDTAAFRRSFTEAMDDDFNTAQAIAVLFDLARELNRAREAGQCAPLARDLLLELGGVMGLTFAGPKEAAFTDAGPFIEMLVNLRQELRKAKQYQLADSVRQKLEEVGIALEDTPKGTVWKRNS
jgi:cysteinyl-tRNA synthetase